MKLNEAVVEAISPKERSKQLKEATGGTAVVHKASTMEPRASTYGRWSPMLVARVFFSRLEGKESAKNATQG